MSEKSMLSPELKRQLENQPIDLPVFHPIALRLQRMLANYDFTVDEVSKVASEDQALAGQMLRMANSPFYAGLTKVLTIRDAVVRLGAQQVANLAMAVTQADSHRSRNPEIQSLMVALWRHSHSCAIGCKWLADNCGFRGIAQETFLAGLLHDVGKLYLLKGMENLLACGSMISAGEMGVALDEMHVEMGVRLMEHWDFPELFVEVVRDHHGDDWDQSNESLAIVRLVNRACRKIGIGLNQDTSLLLAGTAEARTLEMKDLELAELEVMLEDSLEIDI